MKRRRNSAAPYKWLALATYNDERGRGIVHTPEWVKWMEREQRLFDSEMRVKHGLTGIPFAPTPPPPPVDLT